MCPVKFVEELQAQAAQNVIIVLDLRAVYDSTILSLTSLVYDSLVDFQRKHVLLLGI